MKYDACAHTLETLLTGVCIWHKTFKTNVFKQIAELISSQILKREKILAS